MFSSQRNEKLTAGFLKKDANGAYHFVDDEQAVEQIVSYYFPYDDCPDCNQSMELLGILDENGEPEAAYHFCWDCGKANVVR